MIRTYAQYPELKKIDENITEVMKKVSKAVLSRNEILVKTLHNENDRLQEQRVELLKKKLFHSMAEV